MGYLHILNLYRDQSILMFRECYALEKIHGTSAHVTFRDSEVHFFAGGESHVNFCGIFNKAELTSKFVDMGHEKVTVYGEAYGGKQQKQAWRYGPKLKFVVFDVKVGDFWLDVPNAAQVAERLGMEFVYYARCPAEICELDLHRDAPSEQARRNGVEGDQPREGVVLRPIREMTTNDGSRIMSKHKRAEERETATQREVGDPAKLAVLEAADAIAEEWVTTTRLEHVLDKLGSVDIKDTPKVIIAMIEDVVREASGEIVDSKEARKAIGKKTAFIFQKRFRDALNE